MAGSSATSTCERLQKNAAAKVRPTPHNGSPQQLVNPCWNIMSKKERQDFHAGLKKESHRSNILLKALGKFATLAGLIYMITPHEFVDSSGIFESETLFIRSPGPEGKFLSDPT